MVNRILRFSVVSVAGLYLIAYVVIAAARMRYPFELEWLEGGGLETVRRLLAGQAVYVRPTLDFLPFLYTPLYYYVCALVAGAIGHVDFFSMRLVSFTASIVVLGAIVTIVRRETTRWHPAWLACGLMLATYGLTDGWFDIARVDTLFIALLLVGICAMHIGTSGALAAAGVCLALSLLTKQTALFIALPLMVWCALKDRSRSLFVVVPFVVMLAITTFYFQRTTGGWYWYYIFDVQRQAGFLLRSRVIGFWTRDLFPWMAIAGSFGGFYLLTSGLTSARRSTQCLAVAAVAMIVSAWLSRLRSGNAVNVLMPAYAGLAMLWGLGVAEAENLLIQCEDRVRRSGEAYLHALCLVQFVVLAFNPVLLMPTSADAQAGDRIVRRIAAIDGDVFVPCHGYLAGMAGKRSYAHLQQIVDVVRIGDRAAEAVSTELKDHFDRRHFSAVVPCGIHEDALDAAGLSASYVRAEVLFAPGDRSFLTRAGARLRPEAVYVRR